jgi:ATP-dependent Clp protease ATP-binding subunit ClpA
MAKKIRELNIEKYFTTLFPTDKKTPPPLKETPQIPFILDTLGRKEHHHILLFGTPSEKYNMSFLESIAFHLADENVPKTLRESHFWQWDIAALLTSGSDAAAVEQSFKAFTSSICASNKRILLAINHIGPLLNAPTTPLAEAVGELLKTLVADPQFRILVVSNTVNQRTLQQHPDIAQSFSGIKLNEPSHNDALAILKTSRDELENFHHVIIPDETFAYALSMANHYLSGQQLSLDKALQLLDSGAARASALERNEQTGHKPVLTNSLLANIVSSWTKIPLSHLQHNKFKANDFIQAVQKNIFGQDPAINVIGLALQYARLKLQTKVGPLCSFLFAGPPNVGKTETAFAIAEQLFGFKGALLRVSLDKSYRPASLSEIKVMTHADENYCLSLFEAIQQSPYAVVLLENVNQAPPGTMDLFHDILMQGQASDDLGNKYDFRHAIVIITTTLGADRIITLTQPQPSNDAAQTLDLMQLVLNEPTTDTPPPQQTNLSPQELCEEMMPALETYFSSKLLRQLNIVPFSLLDYTPIEKIIRLKLKALAKQLDGSYGIELAYSPEVVRFLVQETLWRGETTRPIDKTLEQHLYSCVAHELLSHSEDKTKPKRLQLQLNDAGQLLRCEFVATAEATLYQL